MYYNLIKNYINKLTKVDIINFSRKYNVTLNDNELDVIYSNLKLRWLEIYNGNGEVVIESIRDNLREEIYLKLIDIYDFAKENYYKFL